jgi:hypothetical protein
MAAGFVGFANNLESMTVDGFVQKFSSNVHEIARYMPNQRHEIVLKSLFDLVGLSYSKIRTCLISTTYVNSLNND